MSTIRKIFAAMLVMAAVDNSNKLAPFQKRTRKQRIKTTTNKRKLRFLRKGKCAPFGYVAALKHPFRPIAKLATLCRNIGHNYNREIIKMRMGKLKPKQIRILNYKLQAAGIEIAD